MHEVMQWYAKSGFWLSPVDFTNIAAAGSEVGSVWDINAFSGAVGSRAGVKPSDAILVVTKTTLVLKQLNCHQESTPARVVATVSHVNTPIKSFRVGSCKRGSCAPPRPRGPGRLESTTPGVSKFDT